MDDADVRSGSAKVIGKDEDDEASAKDGMMIGAELKRRVVELCLLIASSCETE